MWGSNDLRFNGYRLDTPGGQNYSATTINVHDVVPEGSYFVEDRASNAFHQKRQMCSARQYALRPVFQKNVTPRFYIVAAKTKYTGILAEPAFMYTEDLPGTVLTVRYSAPWMLTAWAERGVSEVGGPKANPRILEYYQASGYWGKDDSGAENAWCASFVTWVMKKHNFVPPDNAFRALSWKSFGKTLDAPVYGAIGVKLRKGGGHVAFVVGKDAKGHDLYMLGGNQQDQVNVSRSAMAQWDAFVLPESSSAASESLPVYLGVSKKAGSEA